MVDKSADKSVFRFKRFELANEKSAMKIGTDGVLLGAWADVSNARTAWDVGCGTGLITLMLAQRTDNMDIIGIEIDSIFDCDLAINSTFSKLYTSTLIHTELEGEADGSWLNLTTLTWEELVMNMVNMSLERKTETSSPTTTPNPCKPSPNMN